MHTIAHRRRFTVRLTIASWRFLCSLETFHYTLARLHNVQYFTYCKDCTVYFYAFDLDFQKPSCVCVLTELPVSEWLDCWVVFHRLHKFTCSAVEGLKDKGEGVVVEGWGAWVTYHLMLPLLHNPLLSNGGENADEATKQNNGMQKEKGRQGEKRRLPSSLVYQCKFLTRQASPSSPSLCFPGIHFDWISILMKDCNAPKLCLNHSINSQQLSLLLICNFCCAPVEKLMG